jgi:hypothetical protein
MSAKRIGQGTRLWSLFASETAEDHLKLFRSGVPLDPDLNKYDLNHARRAPENVP